MRKVIVTGGLAAALLVGGTGLAWAQDGSGASAPADAQGDGAGRHGLRRRVLRAAVGVAAETIGIERADLVAELRAGKSVAVVAGEHGVERDAVVEALVGAANARIDRAVEAGRLDTARADDLRARAADRAPRLVDRVPGAGNGGGPGD